MIDLQTAADYRNQTSLICFPKVRYAASPATSPSQACSRKGIQREGSCFAGAFGSRHWWHRRYIAWRQWRTAHDKVKLDLFDPRLAAYQRLKDAVAPIAASGKVTLADAERFARAMYDMRFLFDKETEACVDQIYRAMLDKHTSTHSWNDSRS